LIAGSLDAEAIRESIGADSLGYVSLDGLIEATTLAPGKLCHACFDGEYPMPVTESDQGKYLLEGPPPPGAAAAASQSAGAGGSGGSPQGRHSGGLSPRVNG